VVESMPHCPDVTESSSASSLPETVGALSPTVKAAALPPDYQDPPELWDAWPSALRAAGRLDATAIARQLTLIDAELFRRVTARDLLCLSSGFARKLRVSSSSPGSNVIARFRATSVWVTTEILARDTVKDRAKIYGLFIKIAKQLRELNNFESLYAVLSGLNAQPLARLRHTQEAVKKSARRLKEELDTLFSADSCYRVLRTVMTALPPTTPCVPHLGIAVTDLTFIRDTPVRIGKLLNWRRCVLFCNHIEQVLAFTRTQYHNLRHDPRLFAAFSKLPPPMTPDELHRRSLRLEPRNVPRSQVK